MQIQVAMRYYIPRVARAITEKLRVTNAVEDVEKKELLTTGGNVN